MSKSKPATKAKPAPAKPAPPPHQGGSYVREDDGTLKRVAEPDRKETPNG